MRAILSAVVIVVAYLLVICIEANLKTAVNMALKSMYASGEYEQILAKYGWNEMNAAVSACDGYQKLQWPTKSGVLKEVLDHFQSIVFCHDPRPYEPYLISETEGFEIDLAQGIVKQIREHYKVPQLKYSWSFIYANKTDFWTSVKQKIESFQCDIALSAILITDERKKEATFSCPVLARQKVLIRSSLDASMPITDVSSANQDNIKIITYNSNQALVSQLIPKAQLILTNYTDILYKSLLFDTVHLAIDDSDWSKYIIHTLLSNRCNGKCRIYPLDKKIQYLGMVIRTKTSYAVSIHSSPFSLLLICITLILYITFT
jgi:ABC-type amino acid transport substrate-binding protein